jgi:hypothetical protein
MSGAIPPLLLYAFTAWCLVKQSDNSTFTFTFTNHNMLHVCYSWSAFENRHRRLVIAVVLPVLVLMITTISWGVPILLARFPPEPNTQKDLPPSDSKEGLYTRAAVSADSTVCPPIGRYKEPLHILSPEHGAKETGPKGKRLETGEDCTVRSFITCTPHKILLGRSNQGWDGKGM